MAFDWSERYCQRPGMIKAINSQPNSRVAAVFSSNADRAKAYPAENKIPNAYDNLKAGGGVILEVHDTDTLRLVLDSEG